jgi:hypothetical protein
VVQIHSPRPLPNFCLSLIYANFSAETSLMFCGPVDPLWTNSGTVLRGRARKWWTRNRLDFLDSALSRKILAASKSASSNPI